MIEIKSTTEGSADQRDVQRLTVSYDAEGNATAEITVRCIVDGQPSSKTVSWTPSPEVAKQLSDLAPVIKDAFASEVSK